MGSYIFKWPHAASEVFVTGTFDDWSKSEKLSKTAEGFEKKVQLPQTHEKIMYKFVVDGTWTTDHTAASETDAQGNVNNILTPDHILSSAAPQSTTTGLAGQVPLEKSKPVSSQLPGSYPETPFNENKDFSVNPLPATSGSSNPIKLAPGADVPHSSSYTSNTIGKNVTLDKESYERGGNGAQEQSFSVNPLPATAGSSNPVKLAPGEQVPHSSSYTDADVNSHVTLDKESYENSGSGVPNLSGLKSNNEQSSKSIGDIFGLPAIGGAMIPESSLPMGDASRTVENHNISSAGPQSTTAQLAGQQPIEPRGVPEVVSVSQQEAGASPEASASPEVVQEKSQVEQELLTKVDTTPATTESGITGKSEKGYLATVAGGLSVAVAGGAYAARDKLSAASGQTSQGVLPSSVQNALPSSVQNALPSSVQNVLPTRSIQNEHSQATTNGVPETVIESQQRAHADPEASANPAAVREKSAVEQELEQKIQPIEQVESPVLGVPSAVAKSFEKAHADPEAAANPEAVREKSAVEKELTRTVQPTEQSASTATGVPSAVTKSFEKAHADPEAAANPEAVREKSAVEKELEQRVQPTEQIATTASGVPSAVTYSLETAHADPEAAANPEAVREKSAVEKELEQKVKPVESSTTATTTAAEESHGRTLAVGQTETSRDVSPMTKPGEASMRPAAVTTTSTAPATPKKDYPVSTPVKSTPATPASETASPSSNVKKDKRKSFFGKLKDKLK